jgi:hypothetical protein
LHRELSIFLGRDVAGMPTSMAAASLPEIRVVRALAATTLGELLAGVVSVWAQLIIRPPV